MPTWAVLQHVSFETPALIGTEAERRGIDLRINRMDLGQEVPPVEEIEGLIVMGGPMGSWTRRSTPACSRSWP